MGEKLPKAKDIRKGFFRCENCGDRMPLEPAKALSLGECPKCHEQLLYPKIVNGLFIYKPLGGGGMGSVYMAMDLDGKKEYAIKLLPRNFKHDKGLINALMREGEIGLSLGSHPNIVPAVAAGEDDGEFFLATEFVRGERLDLLIESEGPIPERRAAEIILQLIEAESHICKCGFLYRDMKPENVMIKPDGTAVLYDFGLCVPLEDAGSCNSGSSLEGSPFYLPPERVVGAPEGEYSEIYSLGMLMFHMLSGHTYYSRSAIAQDKVKSLLLKHVKSPRVVSAGALLPSCRPALIRILDRMMARFPNDRFPDFVSLKEAIEKIYGPRKKDSLVRNIIYFEMAAIAMILGTASLILLLKRSSLFKSLFDALPF